MSGRRRANRHRVAAVLFVACECNTRTYAALFVFNGTVAMLLFSIAEAGTEGLAPAFTGASS